jgi:DnaA family protein
VQHLRALGAGAPPVYLWGPAGRGKTHLLRALARERQARGEQLGAFAAADALPWTFDEGWSLVVLDGCERLDAPRQRAAFALERQRNVTVPLLRAMLAEQAGEHAA